MAETNTKKYPSGTLLKALPNSQFFRPQTDSYWVVIDRYQNEDLTYMVQLSTGRGAALANRHVERAFSIVHVPDT